MVILFLILLPMQVFVWSLLGAYTAHCFLFVVEDTAAGVDAVKKPNEQLIDWVWKLAYMAWLLALVLIPVGFIVPILNSALQSEDAALGYLVACTTTFWLLFPFGLLSTLSGGSRWVPFSVTILRMAARRPGSVAVFYSFSVVVLAVSAACYYVALSLGSLPLIFMAGAVGAAGLLIYARLLGRLAWVLRVVQLPGPTRAKLKGRRKRVNPYPDFTSPKIVAAEELNKRMNEEGTVVTLPMDGGEVESYGMADDSDLFQSKKNKRKKEEPERPKTVPFDGPSDPYELAAGEMARVSRPADVHQPSAEEIAMHSSRREPSLPNLPLVTGVFNFPWQPTTLPIWGLLSVCFIVLQGLILLQWTLAPR